jgi:hypothetical protein
MLVAATAGFVVPALAQLPAPRLDTVFPPGATTGTEIEIQLTGTDLNDTSGILFDVPGITVSKLDGLKFKLAIAADCPAGVHELRATGPKGLSTPQSFVVSALPAVLDSAANHARDAATALACPGVAMGRFDAEQRDFYKLTLKKDQQVTVSCASQALDSPADPVITVYDRAGKTIAYADNVHDRDAALGFKATADGDYFVAIWDRLFGGGADHVYRLEVGRETSVVSLRPPASAPDFGPPPSDPNVPNHTAAQATSLELPARTGGRLGTNWYSFHAEKDHALWVEIVSDRLGHETDAALMIEKVTRDAQGAEQRKTVLELDDLPDLPAPVRWLAASRDPAGRFVPDETAAYRLRVTNRFSTASTQTNFQLVIRDAAPDFALLALPESPANDDKKFFVWQPALRRCGGIFFHLGVLRRGYDGPITIRAEGLPPGVTASGAIAAGATTGTLTFYAAGDAKAWSGFVKVFGEGGGVSREVQGEQYRWNIGDREKERIDARLCRMALGVIEEPAPLAMEPAATEISAPIGGSMEIPLKISRPAPLAQAKGEWQLSPVGLPGLVKFDPVKIDGGAATEAKLTISLANKDGNALVAGTYTFHIRGRGVVGYKENEKAGAKDLKHVEFSQPITLRLTEPAKTADTK